MYLGCDQDVDYTSTLSKSIKTSCAVAYYRIVNDMWTCTVNHPFRPALYDATSASPCDYIIAGRWPWHRPPRPCAAPRIALFWEVASGARSHCAYSSACCSPGSLQQEEETLNIRQKKPTTFTETTNLYYNPTSECIFVPHQDVQYTNYDHVL